METSQTLKMVTQQKAIKQLSEMKRLGKELRLAADGWDEEWKTIIATLMSARTTDKVTIPIAQRLFERFDSVGKLAGASEGEIAGIIRGVNFYKTKAKHISELAKILIREYDGKVPHEFEKLVELPGVGRKTANVFLAEIGEGRIGVDTHLSYCSRKLGWTSNLSPYKIELDLERLFPKELWAEINRIVVRFGQSYSSKKIKDGLLNDIKKLK